MFSTAQLKSMMLRHLKSFGIYKTAPTYHSTFEEMLPNDDGYGTATSRRLFKGIVIRDLVNAGHDKKLSTRWPKNWAEKNIDYLAPRLAGEAQ
ncbi:MAG: hypothetical protein KJP25_09610 [Gammaproteobacteria bacterium]|nr:hypothetical protein [Gammaproteobacteria bacterium]NND38510.1 hypothetical protein [Pseudomonadales bacterium]MBT8150512.1 hypothetical protein [Gammaproteobacteria bacterium]NNL11625.1 hypothetical protein [Pseudomonadales bacterium]NNM11897.1 hypothetical protein [Pseudomonadales bacterium]